jgi:hypothetical protein
MPSKTKVIPGKIPGRFSFTCEYCGDCGGNYPTRIEAQRYADIHGSYEVPEHRPKPP